MLSSPDLEERLPRGAAELVGLAGLECADVLCEVEELLDAVEEVPDGLRRAAVGRVGLVGEGAELVAPGGGGAAYLLVPAGHVSHVGRHRPGERAVAAEPLRFGELSEVDVAWLDLEDEDAGSRALESGQVLGGRDDHAAGHVPGAEGAVRTHPAAARAVADGAEDPLDVGVRAGLVLARAGWGEVVDDEKGNSKKDK